MNIIGVALAMSMGGLVPTEDVAPQPEYDAVLDLVFRCPEAAPNMKAYFWELGEWLHLAKVRHPDWSTEQMAYARGELFAKYHCRGHGWFDPDRRRSEP